MERKETEFVLSLPGTSRCRPRLLKYDYESEIEDEKWSHSDEAVLVYANVKCTSDRVGLSRRTPSSLEYCTVLFLSMCENVPIGWVFLPS